MRYDHGFGRLIAIFVVFSVILTIFMLVHLGGQSDFATETIEIDNDADALSYGIVFDCGSSGTRVYIYYWPLHSGDSHQLLDIDQLKGPDGKPLSKKVSPGLSTYDKNTNNSAEYLKPLLEFAAGIIPSHKHSETPLYILATAGMRLISPKSAQAILDDITHDIPKWFEFQFDKSHAEVISGKVEGMYAWISLNYMLDRFPHGKRQTLEKSKTSRLPTVGVVDMGGGSLQIAFEVEQSNLKSKEKTVTFSLGSVDNDPFHTYTLYVTTFLGFGANSALSTYKKKLITRNSTTPIKSNCQPSGFTEEATVDGKQYQVEGTGDVTACMADIKPLLNQSKHCSIRPCSLDGVYQPSISSHSHFYGISEYWYSTYDVLNLQGTYSYTDVHKHAQLYCGTSWSNSMKKFEAGKYPHADMQRMRNECFKVSWIMTVLHDGLHFHKDFSHFLPVNEIDGQEVQWSLGALVYRTRHLAARVSPRFPLHTSERSSWASATRMVLPYVLVICFMLVIGAILLYCRNLQRMKVVPSLTSVPSMSYFMVNADQVEQGLVEEKHYYP